MGQFFADLFDFSFKKFITLRLISLVYVLTVIGSGLFAIYLFATGVNQGGAGAVAGVIIAPLFFLFVVIYSRVVLEMVANLFRIGQYVKQLAEAAPGDKAA